MKKRFKTGLLAVLISLGGFGAFSEDAFAKRMGGGSGFGKTAPSYSRQATPPTATPNTPAPAKATPAPTQNPTGAAQQPQKNRFLGPLMGLAAGLGLAALFSHFGLGDGMANMLGLFLLVGIAVFLIRKLFVMMKGGASARPAPAYGVSGGSTYGQAPPLQPQPEPQQPVHRDSVFGQPSASGGSDPRAAFDHMPSPVSSASGDAGMLKALPEGFDEAGFVSNAKKFFNAMQALYDKADLAGLREYTSDEAFEHLSAEIRERGSKLNQTDVLSLNAELLGFERDVDVEVASVVFTGMVKEQADTEAESLHEMWVMSRPVSGGGWVLSGIHSL